MTPTIRQVASVPTNTPAPPQAPSALTTAQQLILNKNCKDGEVYIAETKQCFPTTQVTAGGVTIFPLEPGEKCWPFCFLRCPNGSTETYNDAICKPALVPDPALNSARGGTREDYPRVAPVAPVPSTTLRPVAVPTPKVPKTEADCDAEFAAGRMTERDYEKCLMAAQGVSPAIAGAPSSFGGLSLIQRAEFSPIEQPKKEVTCYGANDVSIPENAVATGEDYGDAPTEMNDNQRWRCVPHPKDPTLGMWEQCPGCPLSVIPSYLGKAEEYIKEAEEFVSQQNDFLACKSEGQADSKCVEELKKNLAEGQKNLLDTKIGVEWKKTISDLIEKIKR